MRIDDQVVANAKVRALEKRIRELERVLAKKTLENGILREILKVGPCCTGNAFWLDFRANQKEIYRLIYDATCL